MADTKYSAGTAVATPTAGLLWGVDEAGTDKVLSLAQASAVGGGAVQYTAAGSAQGAAIADYFASTLSLDASSTYEIEAHAYFLKTTAGTVIWTWLFGSAPVMSTSHYDATPITGFTTATVTGTELFGQATAEAVAAMAHAASGSLTTAVRHSFIFKMRVRTNAATTLQLRSTQSAGTLTPQAGSYMRAIKLI